MSTIISTKIIFVHHLLSSFRGIVEATIPALRSAYTEQTTGMCTTPPESPSFLSSALRCYCCYWFSIYVFLSPASFTLSLHANCLEDPLYSFSIVEATILRTDYCRFLLLVCLIVAGISSTRRYPCSVFLNLVVRSCGHIGGYHRFDDTCPLSFPYIVCF